MITKTIAIYVFFDDLLKIMHYPEPANRKAFDSEKATAVLIVSGAQYFSPDISIQ